MVKLSDGLIRFLQNHIGKPIKVMVKEDHSPTSGILIGFDGNVLLLNLIEEGKTEPSGSPLFVDIDWVCIVTTPLKEKDLESYGREFEDFKKEYEASKKIMKAVYAAETT